MDDPAVEPELDALSLILPLPFRVAIIVVLGVWCWAVNLHYLHVVKIDVPALIRYPSRSNATAPSHHLSTYRLATLLSGTLAINLLLYWFLTHNSPKQVLRYEGLPIFYLLLLAACFFLPVRYTAGKGRSRFLATLKRISIGGIAETADGKFGDVLVADALTSYAKVLGDLYVSFCLFFSSDKVATTKPDRSCGGAFIVPLILAVPSLIRLRQCLIEYGRVKRSYNPGSNASWGGQHLANACKYATAFPVITLSAMQRNYSPGRYGISETALFRLWLLFVVINSMYSFYWDVARDWDLTLFAGHKARNNPEHPWGLRQHRFFYSNKLYYTAIGIDFVLRCTWSLKLSPHLDHFSDLEGSIFTIEILEVLRRWLWNFFRIETEWVRNNRGPAPDDILLGEYLTKHDED